MLAEHSLTGEAAFVTLTYADPELSWVHHQETDTWVWTLEKMHLQKYLRAVRDKAASLNTGFRYFACGEYGEKTGRPHYHLISFGLGIGGVDIFKGLWKKGLVSVYEANARTMAYVAKYCLKGSRDPEPWTDFIPGLTAQRVTVQPFRLTSRSPPIGGGFAKNIADSLTTRSGSQCLVAGDTHSKRVLRFGKDKYPLDRTMRDRVIAELDIPPAMSDALFSRDEEEPDYEQIEKAAANHIKALRKRHQRAKL